MSSSDYLSRRHLKAIAARVLPEAIKQPFRGVLYGYRGARVSLPVAFGADAASPIVVIDGGIRLRFEEKDRRNIRIHLADHGAAVEEMASFVEIAQHASTFFDIGADRAIFSNIFCAMGTARRAVAYEPSTARYAEAAALTALNGFESRLILRPAAAGASAGRSGGTLFADGTIVPDSHDPAGQAAEMEMTTVDREVETLGLVPDVVKIDVEGYEYEVLRGARELLRTRKPALCLELHLDLLDRRGIAPREVVEHLQSYGYRFRSCVGRPLEPADVSDSIHAILRLVAY
jgi:FkbM family methyltransferase